MPGLTRRQVGLSGAAAAVLGASGLARSASLPEVELPDHTRVPALGLGTWTLGQGRRPSAQEEAALRTGLSLGLTLIDTAEVYGGGQAEEMTRRAIGPQRDQVFLVSKVAPQHATAAGIRKSCTASLGRLGTDHLDLYLLHWRDGVSDLAVVVDAFEQLRQEKLIRHWGVSNFLVKDMEDLFKVRGGRACATNQVRYNLADRGIERDLLPWCNQRGMPIMAYSPLGRGSDLLQNATLVRIAGEKQVSATAVAIAWTMRNGRVITITESGSSEHVTQNAAALSLVLSDAESKALDEAFPA
jgi:diketogulonate reductase-like aldo/keto reductase